MIRAGTKLQPLVNFRLLPLSFFFRFKAGIRINLLGQNMNLIKYLSGDRPAVC
jgi:hypothetical protein